MREKTVLKENKKRKKQIGLGGFDIIFFIIVLSLTTIGLIMMFSSSYTYAYYKRGDSFYFLKRQLFFVVIGIIIMFGVSTVDYRKLKNFASLLLIVSYVLLVVVLIVPPPAGYEEFHRWIRLPLVGTFQPSEIAKFAIILFFSYHMDKFYRHNNGLVKHNSKDNIVNIGSINMARMSFNKFLYILILLSTCALIYAENHVSGALLVFAIGFFMLYLAGFRNWQFVAVLILFLLLVMAVIIKPEILPGHASPRIKAWLDKDYSPMKYRWQTNNALYAIASGGFFGKGIGNSTQKHLYVSEPQNDFIFSIVCEELGLIGGTLIIGLFIALLLRGLYIANRSRDRFGTFLCLGIVFQISIQAALNIGVVTDMLPNTGISLPFFSYGGTAMIMLLAELGIVLSISRSSRIRKF
ncbi:MAG: putative peptidoglycan glycosyltransferase FtsW [Clostridia bacterium]|nr:putative peptidoglycan glycosyltransferase FtsW [Clostridia bacterium]